MAEELQGAPAPDDDLRATINAAWDSDTADEPVKAVEPALEAAEKAADKPRDELGRFAPKAEDAPSQPTPEPVKEQIAKPVIAATPDKATPAVVEGQATQPTGPLLSPPPGWSIAAKTEWISASPAIKEAVVKREEEISNGFAKLAEYKGLDSYVDMARQNGRALPDVIQAYVNADNMLNENPISGLAQLCRMYNVHPVRIAQEAFGYNPAQHQQGQQPGQQQGTPNQTGVNQPQAIDPRLASYLQALEQKQRMLEERVQTSEQQQEQAEQSAVNSEIAQFAKNPEHKYFENVRETMSQLINTGAADNLNDAYEKACWAHPEIRKTFLDEQFAKRQADAAAQAQAKSEQAKRTSKSLGTGAPITGAARAGTPSATLRDELLSAWDEAAA